MACCLLHQAITWIIISEFLEHSSEGDFTEMLKIYNPDMGFEITSLINTTLSPKGFLS